MRKNDYDCSLMCKIQGSIFEKSLKYLNCSSPLFIKKYMMSEDALSMDKLYFLNTTKSDTQVLLDMKDTTFGTTKYSDYDMYWMGYIYRYWSYTYEIDSKQLYKMFPGTKLIKYSAYSENDPKYTIDLIIEENNLKMPQVNNSLAKSQNIITKQIDKFQLKIN